MTNATLTARALAAIEPMGGMVSSRPLVMWESRVLKVLQNCGKGEAVMQETLQAEMTDTLGAEKDDRTAARLGYRSGHHTRTLVTPVGKLEC